MTHFTPKHYAVPVKLSRVAIALSVAALLTLAGCSFGGPTGGGTGGGGQSGSSDGSESSESTETSTETNSSEGLDGYEGKPATFPTDVPIIDGDVVFGVDLGTGWTVIVKTDDVAAAYTNAEAKLTGAGFTAQISSTEPTGSFGSFSSDKYTVQVTSADSADYGPSVTYVVILNG